jgi:hypothetical protein
MGFITIFIFYAHNKDIQNLHKILDYNQEVAYKFSSFIIQDIVKTQSHTGG